MKHKSKNSRAHYELLRACLCELLEAHGIPASKRSVFYLSALTNKAETLKLYDFLKPDGFSKKRGREEIEMIHRIRDNFTFHLLEWFGEVPELCQIYAAFSRKIPSFSLNEKELEAKALID